MTFDGLRIVLVGPLPPPAGGMANQTRQLAELLRGEGATVEVVQVNAPYRPAWAERLKGIRAVFRLLPYLGRLWQACGRADIVHVMANSGWSWHLFAAPAIRIAALRGKSALVNYRGGEAGSFLRTAAASVRRTMRLGAGLLLPSGFLLEVFASHGMKGRVVPNIVDLQRFHPAEVYPPRSAGPHIVVARNLEPIYGIDVALRAFAVVAEQVPAARMSVAGSGPLREELGELAVALGIAAKVSFTGRLDRDQMAALYREADLSLNPSHVDNMPNSVLESLACGVPVVSTNVGGVPFIVDNERTALLVPARDHVAMGQAALRILTDAMCATRLRTAGLAEVQHYRWEAVRDVLLAAYRDALPASAPLTGPAA
ncbi:glycosyltransferase family 4 protein [Thauera linaloolentis]|uniref:Group 1 glycosyl transferase n=1 Tax=Thauera linaloolentis (strain DSM 12138 / JCM 21573 / CCUG 41526 / CIP 105981 / IAM 15112 / NBRC 102519 / 47Lol) TaxID=1123367 RepID=N6Z7M9_THAL4|nr:glycosyltransferase family 4 protein [Thauera linaloolentis]ENO90597.1 group 1 glycosyl transferase [Thauera linaloolentis 47Lol = DSM 12138]MCM8566103.1 glycosyltransferase family 4 protein [Thauera linaloolentis]